MKCITFSNFFIPLLNVYGTKDLKMKLYFETCYFGKISFIFMCILHTSSQLNYPEDFFHNSGFLKCFCQGTLLVLLQDLP